MTAPDERPVLSPLDMALNLARHVEGYAYAADADPLTAHVHRLGARQAASAELAARLALVSIAEDVHRIAEVLVTGPGPDEP